MIAALGRRVYFGGYGLLSLALLAWIIAAAGRAPCVELWPQQEWARWAPNLTMPIARILVVCGAGIAQPFTLGGRRAFDLAAPGFATISRHPLFVALALWSGAQLVPNGDLAHVILFGSFLVMALVAIPAFDAKARRSLGPAAPAFFAATAILSAAPLARRDGLRPRGRSLTVRASIARVLWAGLLHLHTPVIGASPFPL